MVPLAVDGGAVQAVKELVDGTGAARRLSIRPIEIGAPRWTEIIGICSGVTQGGRWGNRRGESAALPLGEWTRLETWEGGGWAKWRPSEAIIPATLGLDGHIWHRIRQGVRGLLIVDAVPRVFLLVEPSSHYSHSSSSRPIRVSPNVHRRHLNESRRAMVAARITTLHGGSNQHEKKWCGQLAAPRHVGFCWGFPGPARRPSWF
jgi:hypothetical protein